MKDNVLKLLTSDQEIRLVVADATAPLQYSNVHDMRTAPARALYKDIFTNCCLLRGLLTEEQRLTVSIRFALPGHSARGEVDGTGHVHCSFSTAMRSFAGNVSDLVGEGATMSVTRGSWLGGMFTGTVALDGTSADEFFSSFYTTSDQLETVFTTWTTGECVRGWMVQPLPFVRPGNLVRLLDRLRDDTPRLRTAPWAEIASVFAPFATVVERSTARCDCQCSKEMFFGMLMAVDTDDLIRSIELNKPESVQCGVCGTEYVFDRNDLQAIVTMKRTDAKG